MKKFSLALVVFAVVISAGFGFHTYAHSEGYGPGHFFMKHIARELKLTDDQKTQIKGILKAEVPRVEPLMQQLQKSNDAAMASYEGKFDENEARANANQQAQVIADLMVERERVKAQIYQVLTPEQRVQAKQMLAKHSSRMQEHIERFKQELDKPN